LGKTPQEIGVAMDLLPDDLVCEILQRVPYTWHDNLKAVCRSWEGIVSSPHFYDNRNISGHSEQLICFVKKDWMTSFGGVITIYDPLNKTWKRLPPIDDPDFPGISLRSQCVAVNRKLFLITIARDNNETMKSIYIYDFESARWRRGADIPTALSSFACYANPSNGLVYVAGRIGESYNPDLRVTETYNVEEDMWEILPLGFREDISYLQQRHGLLGHGGFGFGVDSFHLFYPSTGERIDVNGDGFEGVVLSATSVEI